MGQPESGQIERSTVCGEEQHMALKPWYNVVEPREDLRDNRPLDASEFAVHLDQVRDGNKNTPKEYRNPELFFERTVLTQTLLSLGSEVMRRLSGETAQASAVFNLATQFGGGKTHALTMLFHLANGGDNASTWEGVRKMVDAAQIPTPPKARTAVFVGTEFDSLSGRGGNGEPTRHTPWGEIAWQLGGSEGFAAVAEHDVQGIAPGGDVIRQFLPTDQPSLILMDEVMNYVSRNRKMQTQLYDFLHNLTETIRGQRHSALVISLQKSETNEISADDMATFDRLSKLVDRLSKAMILSAESETSEIIRRRLFEWRDVSQTDVRRVASEYSDWVLEHRKQLPQWFPVDQAKMRFEATYPFHPSVLTVFESKWQTLSKFQRTRGILRLLAQWVAYAYSQPRRGKEPLITLGTAPLNDPTFRAALLEQLAEPRLESVIISDIAGGPNAKAEQLDRDATDAIGSGKFHRKAACTIFFESNGGMTRSEATLPEIRLAIGEPNVDIGNVETVVEALAQSCYFLTPIGSNRYKFGVQPNLNKLHSDRLASVNDKVDECVRGAVQRVFVKVPELEQPIYFPKDGSEVPNKPAITLIVLAPDQIDMSETHRMAWIDEIVRNAGSTGRTFKSALLFCVPDSNSTLQDDARKLLAWREIYDERDRIGLDETQKDEARANRESAERRLTESVWRAYKTVVLLGKDNKLKALDLGLAHPSSNSRFIAYIVEQLALQDEVTKRALSPNQLLRNWALAFTEWSTRAVRDATYSSPSFVRPLSHKSLSETIAKGVADGLIAYVTKTSNGDYSEFKYKVSVHPDDVDISDDAFIIKSEVAESYLAAKATTGDIPPLTYVDSKDNTLASRESAPIPLTPPSASAVTPDQPPLRRLAKLLRWQGEVSHGKWMNLYTRALSKFAGQGMKITVSVEVNQAEGISPQKIEDMKLALRELGLNDRIDSE
jgi:hypothetical protein